MIEATLASMAAQSLQTPSLQLVRNSDQNKPNPVRMGSLEGQRSPGTSAQNWVDSGALIPDSNLNQWDIYYMIFGKSLNFSGIWLLFLGM